MTNKSVHKNVDKVRGLSIKTHQGDSKGNSI